MSSLASRQKCDMAADLAADVHSLIPDVIADMEKQAGDDPTEDEKSTPMIPVLPNQPAPKKKTTESKSKHTDEPARTTAPNGPVAAKAASKPPRPPVQVTGTVTVTVTREDGP